MVLKVAIIGGGWYGCHIATTLVAFGMDVALFERSNKLFSSASGNNQFRLHLGFHYARHYETRVQSRDGYFRFMERYGHLTLPIDQNIYAIPKLDSLLDYKTYKIVMMGSGIEFDEMKVLPTFLENIAGAFLCQEKIVTVERARQFFTRALEDVVTYNVAVEKIDNREDGVFINGEHFDLCVDATWGHLTPPALPHHFEPTLLLYYRCKENFPAVTLVDGDLCSIYPTENPCQYTLSSVPHTPLGHFERADDARAFLQKVGNYEVEKRRMLMEDQIGHYIPSFRDLFTFEAPQFSMKTKISGQAVDRSTYVAFDKSLMAVMSGKIDTIFHATQRILERIQQKQAERNLS